MECCARLNTCLTKPHEAQEKGQHWEKTVRNMRTCAALLSFELNGTLTQA